MSECDDIYKELIQMYERRYSLSYNDKNKIKSYYEIIFKTTMPKTCDSAYQDALITMISRTKNQNFIMNQSNYRLKAGAIIRTPEIEIISNYNITDKLAEEYLKKFPAKINLFEIFPSDWTDRVKSNSETKNELETETTAEVKNYESAEDLITEIVTMLENQISKNQIQKQLKGATLAGVALSGKEISDYIKQAQE